MTIQEYVERVRTALPEDFKVIPDSEGFDFVIDNGIEPKGSSLHCRQGFMMPNNEENWYPPEELALSSVKAIRERVGG